MTLLIIGFAGILLMAIVVVIDASAAYLQRQGLDNLADGAALYGADLGSAGIYEQGLGDARLIQQEAAVEAAVRDYLARADAGSRFPGIDVGVRVDPIGRSVTVRLQAPLDLPLTIPGSPANPTVGASSTAAVTVVDPARISRHVLWRSAVVHARHAGVSLPPWNEQPFAGLDGAALALRSPLPYPTRLRGGRVGGSGLRRDPPLQVHADVRGRHHDRERRLRSTASRVLLRVSSSSTCRGEYYDDSVSEAAAGASVSAPRRAVLPADHSGRSVGAGTPVSRPSASSPTTHVRR